MSESLVLESRGFIERPRSFCAMGGALLTAAAIPGVVPVLHAAAGCAGSVYWNQLGTTGYLGAGYCGGLSVPSSNVGEHEVIFGGEERLVEQVENTVRIMEGELYVVITGCMSDIIGEDVKAVAKRFREAGVPVTGVETGGFKGDGYKGYDLLLSELLRDPPAAAGQADEDRRDGGRSHGEEPARVNLLGIVPGQDVFWRGNLHYLEELLEALGLQVEAFFTPGSSAASLAAASEADLTVVASPSYGLQAAMALEEEHGVPWLSTPFPIGPTLTADFLRTVGEKTGVPAERIEQVTAREESGYYGYLERIADAYNDLDLQRYAVIVGDANYGPALARFLADDLGWLPKLTVLTSDDRIVPIPAAEETLGSFASGFETNLVYEADASRIPEHLAKTWEQNRGQRFYNSFTPSFVVGSNLEKEFARAIGAGHLSVTFPVGNRVVLSRGYAGYTGALTLIEDLLSVLVAER